MSAPPSNTVKDLFRVFEDDPYNVARCVRMIEEFASSKPAPKYIITNVKAFVAAAESDEVRAWGTALLQRSGGPAAIPVLHEILDEQQDPAPRREFKFTRFFALKALHVLSVSRPDREHLTQVLRERCKDEDEDLLPRLGAACLLAGQDRYALTLIEANLESDGVSIWKHWAALRALRELPVEKLSGAVIDIARDDRRKYYLEIRELAVRALGSFPPSPEIVRAVGEVLIRDQAAYIRVVAVDALDVLGDAAAKADLIRAVCDSNAEVRVRSARTLVRCVPKEEVIAALVSKALSPGVTERDRKYIADALREADEQRMLAAELLGRAMEGPDRDHSQRAQSLLLELGGWSALQRLSQRRSTLQSLDEALSKSEQVVQSTFSSTIRQARINFYFALAVNVVVVLVGIALVIVAMIHLISEPDELASWLVPGSTGALAVLINTVFNSPRDNARSDLTALINVNVIFLGFLRALNEIDATFKHAYLESRDFGSKDMKVMVAEIGESVQQTLTMAARHLGQQSSRDGGVLSKAKLAAPQSSG